MVIKLTVPSVSSKGVATTLYGQSKRIDQEQREAVAQRMNMGIQCILSARCQNAQGDETSRSVTSDGEPHVHWDEEHLETYPERVHSWNAVLQPTKPILKVRGFSPSCSFKEISGSEMSAQADENYDTSEQSPSWDTEAPPKKGQTAGLRLKPSGLRIKLVTKKRSREVAFAF